MMMMMMPRGQHCQNSQTQLDTDTHSRHQDLEHRVFQTSPFTLLYHPLLGSAMLNHRYDRSPK